MRYSSLYLVVLFGLYFTSILNPYKGQFLIKKVKTSFYHDLMIYTKRDASLTSEARDRRPLECKPSKSDGKLCFLQDVFFFTFRGFQIRLFLVKKYNYFLTGKKQDFLNLMDPSFFTSEASKNKEPEGLKSPFFAS